MPNAPIRRSENCRRAVDCDMRSSIVRTPKTGKLWIDDVDEFVDRVLDLLCARARALHWAHEYRERNGRSLQNRRINVRRGQHIEPVGVNVAHTPTIWKSTPRPMRSGVNQIAIGRERAHERFVDDRHERRLRIIVIREHAATFDCSSHRGEIRRAHGPKLRGAVPVLRRGVVRERKRKRSADRIENGTSPVEPSDALCTRAVARADPARRASKSCAPTA